jgi:signal transduction histidine kinase
LQGIFLAMTLLVAAALGWLGWRLLGQDRALARQRRLEQVEAAADRVAGALYRRLAEFEEAAAAGNLPPGAVRLQVRSGSLDVSPPGALLFYPTAPASQSFSLERFAEAEELEFRRQNAAGAAAALRPLAGSADRAVRAEALVRLGRNLRKAGRSAEALAAYGRLAEIQDAYVDGLPAELAAAEARCDLLFHTQRRVELRQEAESLAQRLASGRWRLCHAAWESQWEQACRWLGRTAEPDTGKAALAAAAGIWWANRERDPRRRRLEILEVAQPVLAVTQDGNALLAPVSILSPTLETVRPFRARLVNADGRTLAGQSHEAARLRVERSPSSTKLPWSLEATSDDDGTARLAGRTWLMGGGLALLAAILAAVSVLAARVVSREMAVARLQADFVAAVSHEFRSPLSSISQVSELLNEDRWPSPEHRRKGLGILSRESARLRNLVEGLLDFARMEAGTATYRLAEEDPGDLLRSAVEHARESNPGAQIELQVEDSLPPVRADAEALQRAIWNLLENALKYSPGTPAVQVQAAREDRMLAIRVRDQGPESHSRSSRGSSRSSIAAVRRGSGESKEPASGWRW